MADVMRKWSSLTFSNNDADYPEYLSPDLASVLDPIKVNEGYGSINLRDFYRKLLKTDIQIKNLKKGFAFIKRGNIDLTGPNAPRMKRSYRFFGRAPRRYTRTASSNQGSRGKMYKYDPLGYDLKTDKNVGKTQDDADIDTKANSGVEKEKVLVKEDNLQQEKESKDKGDKKGQNFLQSEDSDPLKNSIMKHSYNKYTQWLDALFGRETPSTRHRRLLQHNDEDDDEDATVDYEEQTKEPWDREKRTISPMVSRKPSNLNIDKCRKILMKHTELEKIVSETKEIYIKPVTEPANLPKSITSDLHYSTSQYNNEINFLIDAALKMKTGKEDNIGHKGNYQSILASKEYLEDSNRYDELVAMAQAYSDYGVLNNKKEIIINNAPGNENKLITLKKTHKTVGWVNDNDDNSHRQRIKLKSNGVSKTKEAGILKQHKLKLFSNTFHSEINNNDVKATKIPSYIPVEKTTNFRSVIEATTLSKSTQKANQKHKERNMMFSGHRRSLKSIEIDKPSNEVEVSETYGNSTNTASGDESYGDDKKVLQNNIDVKYPNNNNNFLSKYDRNITTNVTVDKSIFFDNRDNVSKLREDNLKQNNNSSWGLGEMFGMLADFCMFMAGFDPNQEDSGYRFLYDFVTMLNPSLLRKNNNTSEKENDTKIKMEALDSEKVENIGYKSRVLLSFEEAETVENVTSTTFYEKDKNESYVTNKLENISIESNKANSSIENKTINSGNRTVVKRSADGDSIFWNDMYDDEYGIKDPMEDDMKDKSVVKVNDLIGKDNWIGSKFKMIAKSFKERRNRKMERKKERNLKNARNKTNTHTKRSVHVPDDSSEHMFKVLTANLKKVCQEAAKAVEETTSRGVRADSDQTSTLMKRLAGLMTELVDLQVRQKTCVQLPEDLRSFLAWLTAPSTEEHNDNNMGFSIDTYDGPMSNLDDIMLYSNTRSDCLGTIHDVEDLILRYDEMSEEDKSKMSGVREYLEHQLDFLHKQLSNFNEYGSSVMYQEQSIRSRRQPKSYSNKQRKRQAYKFLNYYGKKHTKHDADDATEDYRSIKQNGGRNKNDNIKDYRENTVGIKDDFNGNRDLRNADDLKNLNDYLSALVKDNETFEKYNKM